MSERVLAGLKPEKVFEYFENISAIPRGSGNTEQISSYCAALAASKGLKYIKDGLGNVVIFKPASKGMESSEPVIIQGHLDMVCEKVHGSTHDFKKDGLKLIVDGDFVHADGTTLGGDDGIAVAMALALIDSDDLKHPPLEVVLTVDEEVGMDGAVGIDTSVLSGKRMINIDSEAEGYLWASCAGGKRVDILLPFKMTANSAPTYEIVIDGLHGGHSGEEIHHGYANSSNLMGELLARMLKAGSYNVASIVGGSMDNAITRESVCCICADDIAPLAACADSFLAELKVKYAGIDDGIRISIKECDKSAECFDDESTAALAGLLSSFPAGIVKMSSEIKGLVQTSLNLGILRRKGDCTEFGFALRSNKNNERDELCERIINLGKAFGATATTHGEYPAWEFKKTSTMRDTMVEVFRELFDKELVVTAVHAGLECAVFSGKMKDLDCVSIGPDMNGIHSPEEKLSISSAARTWDFLVRTLERL